MFFLRILLRNGMNFSKLKYNIVRPILAAKVHIFQQIPQHDTSFYSVFYAE